MPCIWLLWILKESKIYPINSNIWASPLSLLVFHEVQCFINLYLIVQIKMYGSNFKVCSPWLVGSNVSVLSQTCSMTV